MKGDRKRRANTSSKQERSRYHQEAIKVACPPDMNRITARSLGSQMPQKTLSSGSNVIISCYIAAASRRLKVPLKTSAERT